METHPAFRIVSGSREWADAASLQNAYFAATRISEEERGQEFTVLDRGDNAVGWARDGKLTVPQGAQR